jgi:hypothetical protein
MHQTKKILLIAKMLIMSTLCFGQIDNSYLHTPISINSADSNCVGFSAAINNNMRNTEYFNKIELGRTLFGYQINPTLWYQPLANLKIQAGVFLQNDFGSEKSFTQVIPTFTLKTKFNQLEMLFGTLEGASAHNMIEPIFDIARNLEKRIENGFQLKYNSPKNYVDVWIDWEKFIERGDNHKEKFTAGLHYHYLLNQQDSKLKIFGIVQGILAHTGGQIDKDTINKLTMRSNLALGIKASYKIKPHKTLDLHTYLIGYNDTGDTLINNTQQGYASYSHLNYQVKNIHFMISYFNGNNFLAPVGTQIYKSQSIDNVNYFTKNRNLIIPRIMYNKLLMNELKMSLRFEPIIDLQNPYFDYSYSFYLSYNIDKVVKKM